MKITKSILAQIIKEELDHFNESEIPAAVPAAAPEEVDSPVPDLDQTKTDLQKAARATTSSKLAQQIGDLVPHEVKAQNFLRALMAVMQEPGNQAPARVLTFLQRALEQAQAKVKR